MRLIILGAGGFGRTAADIAEQMGSFSEICFLDDNSRGEKVLGPCSEFLRYREENTVFYPAFGNNALRMQWIEKLEEAGCGLGTIIHPTAYVSPKAVIAPGSAILPGAIVNTECRIGRGCLINLGVLIDHGTIVEDGTHVCVGAIIKAENRIPGGIKIEAGTVIENRQFPL